MMEADALAILERILELTKGRADETEAFLSGGAGALTRFGNNEITQSVAVRSMSATVRAIAGGRTGRATTDRLDDRGLALVCERALALARAARPDPDPLPLAAGPQRYERVERYDEATDALTPAARAEAVAGGIEACAGKGLTAAGIYESGGTVLAFGSSRGVRAFHRETGAQFALTALGTDDAAGWAEHSTTRSDRLDAARVTRVAVEKCVASRSPRAIEPGAYTVVLEPDAVSNVLLFLAWMGFGGLSYIEGRSFISGKLGQKVFGDNVTIRDDVYHPLAKGPPFDHEGLPRRAVTLVEKGVAKAVVHDRKTAKRAGSGAESTGHALPIPIPHGPMPMKLTLDPGDASLEDLIRTTRRGLLVTQLHYTNVIDPLKLILTGMTRNGTFLIEDGEVRHPVKNMRFTDAVPRALSNVTGVGRDLAGASTLFGGGFIVPPLRIDGFTFSSATEF